MRFSTTMMRRAMACSVASIAFAGLAWAEPNTPPNASDGIHGDRTTLDRGDHDKHAMKGDKSWGHRAMVKDFIGADLRPVGRDQRAGYTDLRVGVGLAVENVAAGSKADAAGLRAGDVIFQLDDQWVINVDQFCTLLALQDADDDFEVKVYRMEGNDVRRVDIDFEFDQTAVDTMRRQHEDAILAAPDQSVDRQMDRRDGIFNDRDDRLTQTQRQAQAALYIPENFDYSDEVHNFALRTEENGKKLTIKDKEGKVLFEGPYSTPDERAAVPAELNSKFERILLEKMNEKMR